MSADEAKALLQRLEPQIGAAPPEKKALMEAIQKLLQEKIQQTGGK
jgi:hypothetical protein